jgi:tetratricopeptide (TPR) repeat protein
MFYNDGKYFLLERNYLPGPSWNFFKTEAALAVGYDCTGNEIAEDHDFNLRALQQGFEFGFSKNITYKQKSFAGSFSRDIDAQLLRTRNAISKLNSDKTLNMVWGSNLSTPNKVSILLHYYLFKLDFRSSRQLLKDHSDTFLKYFKTDYYFYWGNIALHETAYDDSIRYYSEALKVSEKPEFYNNLAFDRAKQLLKKAAILFPDYYDAQKNLIEFDSGNPLRITPFKIRKSPNRHEYYLDNGD